MKKNKENEIKVKVDWTGGNFAAVTCDERLHGIVIATAPTYSKLHSELRLAIASHVEEAKADGEAIEEWIERGEYEFSEEQSVAAMIRRCEEFTTLKAIAHASGINPSLINHYASGLKKPRKEQRERIILGLHLIGQTFLSMR